METNIALQEKDLELVVSEKTLGSLTTNAKQIRDMVKNALPMYDISNYNDDNIEQAKKDKAALNKAAKSLNSKRIEFEKEFMIPFSEFKEVVSETVQLISECSSKIDNVVKQNEQAYKDTKKAAIIDYFEANNANLVDFNKIFKEAWLNKTVKEKNVFTDIDNILAGIESDIKTIESMQDADVLRTYYLDTLNINNTIQYGSRLKEQRERAKAAEEARQKAEEERLKMQEEIKAKDENQKQPTSTDPFPGCREAGLKEDFQQEVEILTRAFKVTTTRENIIALGNFMNERGIDFDKIELP